VIVAVPTEELRDAVGPLPGVEYVVWDGQDAPSRADEVEVCVPDYRTTIRTESERISRRSARESLPVSYSTRIFEETPLTE